MNIRPAIVEDFAALLLGERRTLQDPVDHLLSCERCRSIQPEVHQGRHQTATGLAVAAVAVVAVFGEQIQDPHRRGPAEGHEGSELGRCVVGDKQRGLVERERRLAGEFAEPNFPGLAAQQVLGADADRPQRVAVEGFTLAVDAEPVFAVARDYACEPELLEKLFEVALIRAAAIRA